LRREVVADLLEALGIGAAQNAIVERLEGDVFASQLPLGVFVAIDAKLGIERKVGAELQEERPEVTVYRIDVIVVHHGGGPHDPRVRLTGLWTPALLSAEHRGLLLRFADEDDPFFLAEVAQVLRHHRVFSLSFAERHQRHILAHHKLFQRRHKAPTHRAHQGRRRQRLAAMVPEEAHYPKLGLQPWHIDVEVHPVDALDRKLHMILEDIGNALCYHAPGSGRAGFASSEAFDPCGPIEPGLPELVMNR
jgi:hypothetical protein